MGPLFSIGVTTYDRNDLLMDCINSILQQDFPDFEIIVGNDFTQRQLSTDMLGISDPRIRIINYPTNLGPVGNANALIAASQGRYFTLLADDDLHSPCYLRAMAETLASHEMAKCIFCSYSTDIEAINNLAIRKGGASAKLKAYTGRQFLSLYLERAIATIGCYGVFDLKYLRDLGGLAQLGHGRSMYAEMPLVLASGLLERVLYLDYPLVYFRPHPGSLSYTFTDVDACKSSQDELLGRCDVLFKKNQLCEDFHRNKFLILNWCVQDFATVMHRSGSIDKRYAIQYLRLMGVHLDSLKGSSYFVKTIFMISRIFAAEMLLALRGRLKRYRDCLREALN